MCYSSLFEQMYLRDARAPPLSLSLSLSHNSAARFWIWYTISDKYWPGARREEVPRRFRQLFRLERGESGAGFFHVGDAARLFR